MGPVTEVYRRVDIFEEDGETPFLLDAGFSSGSVTVDSSRDERRMADLVLSNADGSIKHSEEGIWYDKVVKIERGAFYREGGVDKLWKVQLGEFGIDAVDSQNFPYTIAIKCRDFAAKLLEDEFTTSTTFVKGKKIEDLVRIIATNGSITKFNLPNTGEFSGKDFTFERGVSRWQAITDIVTSIGHEVFFDANGYLTMREIQDPALTPTVFSFKTGPDGTLASWKKSSNQTRLYNRVVVSGDTDGNSLPIYAVAENTDPNSPTSIPRLRRAKTYKYTSGFFTSQAQAQATADKLLKVVGLEEFAITMDSIVLPWLDAGEIVDFLPEGRPLTDPTRFLLTNFNIPLELGNMNPTAKRVQIAS